MWGTLGRRRRPLFAETIIEKGTNIAFELGRDVFTLAEFRLFIRERIFKPLESAKKGLSPLAASLALDASCLQPDRVPFHIADLTFVD